MTMLQTIVQEQIIDQLPLVVRVKNVSANLLEVDSTYYMRIGTRIQDENGDYYSVVSVVPNVSVTVSENGFVGNITMRVPKFFWGTQKATNREYLDTSKDTEQKVPLIWLLEPFTEDFEGKKATIDRSVSCRLFFMDYYNSAWINDQIKTGAQLPMYQLAETFINTIDENRQYFNDIENYQLIPRTRFGTESATGADATILEEQLSGCEMILTFTINKQTDICPFVKN